MLGDPKWFTRRKYTGWGITPATWQGYAYFAIFLLLMFAFIFLYNVTQARIVIYLVIATYIIIIADVMHIVAHLSKDERESIHEAYAERNACWAMSMILTAGFIYQLIMSSMNGKTIIDPIIVIALLAGILAKAITNIYLKDK